MILRSFVLRWVLQIYSLTYWLLIDILFSTPSSTQTSILQGCWMGAGMDRLGEGDPTSGVRPFIFKGRSWLASASSKFLSIVLIIS
jgi:hypothetical protein